MTRLELVPNKQTCWFCEASPATTVRTSYPSGTRRPACEGCVEVGEVMRTLEEVSQTPLSIKDPLSDLCADILLAPYQLRGGKLDS